MTKISIVAVVVDTRQATLYKVDGTTVTLEQGDPRLKPILDHVTPILAKNEIATIDLSMANEYAAFEQKSGGLVRLFRVAKKVVANIFGSGDNDNTESEEVEPQTIGEVPASPESAPVPAKLATAIDDIMKHATPVTAKGFNVEETTTEHTMIAVVEDASGAKKVIPEVETLKGQFAHAANLGSTGGVQLFLKRIASVIDKRGHSVQDLLRFMERGDLPIADDGSIIIYKVLRRKDGHYVDIHSGNVTQRIGSYVCMDPSMVDPNRRNECSNGLHVARRGYIGGFSGDVCVLAKVAPEDVIAVPSYDANKMRVCGYHILFELDADSYSKLKRNAPMTDNPKAQALLGRAIKGDHGAPVEEVRITEGYGRGLKITPLNPNGTKRVEAKGNDLKAVALDDTKAKPTVDVSAVATNVAAAKGALTRQQKAKAIWDKVEEAKSNIGERDAAQELLAFKKSAKVGWTVLGLNESLVNVVLARHNLLDKKPAPVPQTTVSPHRKSKAKPAKVVATKKGPKVVKVSAPKPAKDTRIVDRAPAKAKKQEAPAVLPFPIGTRSEIARALFSQGRFDELGAYQKKVKIGWAALGFSTTDIDVIRVKLGK